MATPKVCSCPAEKQQETKTLSQQGGAPSDPRGALNISLMAKGNCASFPDDREAHLAPGTFERHLGWTFMEAAYVVLCTPGS